MYPVQVNLVNLEDDLFFNKQLLLHYKIVYPQFFSYSNQANLNKINNIYKTRAWNILKECVDIHFSMAINYYSYSREKDIPIRAFELHYIPTITYNDGCTLSLYYDKYMYTGGAHGVTVRTSESWDLNEGELISLNELLGKDQIEYIKSEIKKQVEQTINNENYNYFENYDENIEANFDENNYYITPEGIIIYFQQYEIAPYAAGIPEFNIPVNQEVTGEHNCSKQKIQH